MALTKKVATSLVKNHQELLNSLVDNNPLTSINTMKLCSEDKDPKFSFSKNTPLLSHNDYRLETEEKDFKY
jgi:hypothetical protein